MDQPGPAPCVLLADKGYDADFIRADLEACGIAPMIPTATAETADSLPGIVLATSIRL